MFMEICLLFSALIKHVEMFIAAQTLLTEKQNVAFYSIIYLQNIDRTL